MRRRFPKCFIGTLCSVLLLAACTRATEQSRPQSPVAESSAPSAVVEEKEPLLAVLHNPPVATRTIGLSSLPVVDIFTETGWQEDGKYIRVDGERPSTQTYLVPTISNKEHLYFELTSNGDKGEPPATTLLQYRLADGKISQLLQVPSVFLLSTSMYVPMGESYYTMYFAYSHPQAAEEGQLLVGCNPSTGEYQIYNVNPDADLALYWIYRLDERRLVFLDATDDVDGTYLYGVRTFDVQEQRFDTLQEYHYNPAQDKGDMPVAIGTDQGLFYLQQRHADAGDFVYTILALDGEGKVVAQRPLPAQLGQELQGLSITNVHGGCYAIEASKGEESRNGVLFFEGDKIQMIPLGSGFVRCVGTCQQYFVFVNPISRDQEQYLNVYLFDTEKKDYLHLRILADDTFHPDYAEISAAGDLLVHGITQKMALRRMFIVQDVLSLFE